jgi:hypothetical protein
VAGVGTVATGEPVAVAREGMLAVGETKAPRTP